MTRIQDFVLNIAAKGTKNLVQARKEFGRFNNQIEKTNKLVAVGALSEIASQFQQIARSAVGAFSAPIQTAARLEKTLVQVRTLTKANEEEFENLKNTAEELGATTQFSANQAAEALTFLARAGFDATESVEALPGVLQLAAAGNISLAESADIATNVLQAYGLQVEELGRVNDVLAFTANNSNTTIQELGEAFKAAGPIAKTLGVEFEEVFSVLGQLANNGIKASAAGTSLKNILLDLTSDSPQAQEALERLGVSIKDQDGNFVGVSKALSQFEKGLSGFNGTVEQSQQLAQIFGRIAGPGLSALLTTGSDAVGEFTTQLERSNGTAARVAKEFQDNFSGAVTQLKSAFEGLQIALGDPFLKVLQTITRGIADFVSLVTKLRKETGGAGDLLIAFAGTFSLVASVVGVVGISLVALNAALGGLTVTIGTLSIGVGGLLAILATLSGVISLNLVKDIEVFGITIREVFEVAASNVLIALNLILAGIVKVGEVAANVFGFGLLFDTSVLKKQANEFLAEAKRLAEVENDIFAQRTARQIKAANAQVGIAKQAAEKQRKNSSRELRVTAKESEVQLLAAIKRRESIVSNAISGIETVTVNVAERLSLIEFTSFVDKFRSEVEQLEREYDQGLVDLETFLDQRRRLIDLELQKETKELELQLENETDQVKQAEIKLEIQRAQIRAIQNANNLLQEEEQIRQRNSEAAQEQLNRISLATAQADLKEFQQQAQQLNQSLQDQFSAGLISTDEFFRRRRELIEQGIQKERALLELEIDQENDPARQITLESQATQLQVRENQEIERLLNEQKMTRERNQEEIFQTLAEIRERAVTDLQEKNRIELETLENRQLEEIRILERLGADRKTILEAQALQEQEIIERRENQALEAARRRSQNELEIQQLRARATLDVEDRFGAEQLQLKQNQNALISQLEQQGGSPEQVAEARALQEQELNNLILAQEKEVLNQRLNNAQTLAGGITGILGQITQFGESQSKELFAVNQAAAIANATINTAVGATKALDQGGIFGIAQAGTILAFGALQIGQIAAQGFAEGGFVSGPGTATSDSVPANLSNGEFVQRASAVEKYGVGFMNALNLGKFPQEIARGFSSAKMPIPRNVRNFATGGLVGSMPSISESETGQQGQEPMTINIVNQVSKEFVLDAVGSKEGQALTFNNVIGKKNEFKKAINR